MNSQPDSSITPENLTHLPTAHQAFINHLRQNSHSSSTILAYGKDIEQLIDYELKVHNIQHAHLVKIEHLDQFKEHLTNQAYTAKSISRKINSLKSFFRYLKNRMVIPHNPAETVKHPKYENKNPRVLSKTEYRALRDACRGDLRTSTIVEILLQTGLRISELANLKLSDINDATTRDVSNSTVNGASLTIQPYESQPGRSVPLNRVAHTAIQNWLTDRPTGAKSSHLFITKNGRPLLVRNIRTAIDRYFKLAGISEATVNDLRHTWIAHHLASGASLVAISKIAGHKRLSTTGKYLSFIKDKINGGKMQLDEL